MTVDEAREALISAINYYGSTISNNRNFAVPAAWDTIDVSIGRLHEAIDEECTKDAFKFVSDEIKEHLEILQKRYIGGEPK